jgi:general stress protein YciG
MVWFKVDDKAHSNSKIRKVLAEEPAAIALWTVAGSWSADNLQDGFVPDHQLPWLLPIGAEQLAQVLVTARLWRRVKGGYRFHQWDADGDGTRRNPTKAEVEEDRRKKAEAGRKGGLNSGKTRSRSEARASASASAGAGTLVEPPTRPDPTNKGGTSTTSTYDRARAGTEPPSKCPDHEHLADPPPCGRCAGLRRSRDEADVARRARIAAAPQCRRHRGQPADNCAPCRSEALAPPTGAFPVIVRSSSAA